MLSRYEKIVVRNQTRSFFLQIPLPFEWSFAHATLRPKNTYSRWIFWTISQLLLTLLSCGFSYVIWSYTSQCVPVNQKPPLGLVALYWHLTLCCIMTNCYFFMIISNKSAVTSAMASLNQIIVLQNKLKKGSISDSIRSLTLMDLAVLFGAPMGALNAKLFTIGILSLGLDPYAFIIGRDLNPTTLITRIILMCSVVECARTMCTLYSYHHLWLRKFENMIHHLKVTGLRNYDNFYIYEKLQIIVKIGIPLSNSFCFITFTSFTFQKIILIWIIVRGHSSLEFIFQLAILASLILMGSGLILFLQKLASVGEICKEIVDCMRKAAKAHFIWSRSERSRIFLKKTRALQVIWFNYGQFLRITNENVLIICIFISLRVTDALLIL